MAGFACLWLTRQPDVVIADGGRFVAARAPDGRYFVAADKNEKIVRSLFASETGAVLEDWPTGSAAAERGLDCAGDYCRHGARGRTVAILTGKTGLPTIKCQDIDAIVAQIPAGFSCRSFMPVVDRIDSYRRGAVALCSIRWVSRSRAPTKAAAIVPGCRSRAARSSRQPRRGTRVRNWCRYHACDARRHHGDGKVIAIYI